MHSNDRKTPYIDIYNDCCRLTLIYCQHFCIALPITSVIWNLCCTNKNMVAICNLLFNMISALHQIIFCIWYFSRKQCALLVISTSPQWLCGNSCIWPHHMPKCMSCHKVIVVITGRAHCFHNYIYITLILILFLSDHLWITRGSLMTPMTTYMYIYIYIYIYI